MNKINKIEVFLIISYFFSIVSKISAPIFFVLMSCALCLFYMILGGYIFKDYRNRINVKIFSIITGVFYCFSFLGILFKLMQWPNGRIYINLSLFYLTGLILVLGYMILFKRQKEKLMYYKKIVVRSTILLFGLLISIAF